MSAALPVLFDCGPYRARMTKQACADRWRRAQGPKKRHGNDGGLNFSEQLSHEHCVPCPIGPKHAEEFPPIGGRPPRKKPPQKPSAGPSTGPLRVDEEIRRTFDIADREGEAPVSSEVLAELQRRAAAQTTPPVPKPNVQEKPMIGRCSKCKKANKRLPDDGMCRRCKNATGGGNVEKPRAAPARRAPARVTEDRPAVTIYLEKHAAIEALKARHAAELEAALEELDTFESTNPEVKEQAQAILERIAGKRTRAA